MHGWLNGVQRRPAPGSAPLLLFSAFLCALCVSALSLPATELFFAATATDSFGLQSDYSTELEYDRPIGGPRSITLAWDQCDPGDTYPIHWGRLSGLYTRTDNAGTNLTFTIQLIPPPLTNVLLTVTGEDLSSAPTPTGPWTRLNTNTWTLDSRLWPLDSGLWTNSAYFRAGTQPAAIQILHY